MRRLVACMLGLLLAACTGFAAPSAPPPGPGWARDRSDLPHDPAIHLGVLDNGMRYLVRRNASPPGEVALRLVVHAGSMHETPGTEGAAHFLEHMLFRGTALYPDGEIQRSLQYLGATLGADANATTWPDATIYKINLPRNDSEAITEGLRILRDMASEALLDPALLEVERGVVLAEERARHNPDLERYNALLAARMGDHPYARPPIGSPAAIQTMDVAILRAFYDAYYRPERATLLIVGDVRAPDVSPIVSAFFASWEGRGKPGGEPEPVTRAPDSADMQLHVLPGLGDSEIYLQWFSPYAPDEPTRAGQRRQLVQQLAAIAVNQRMQHLLEDAGRPARAATGASFARTHHVWNGAFARASGLTDAPRALELIATAARQAAEFGVVQEELDRAIELRLAPARQTVDSGGAGASMMMADAMALNSVADPVFITPNDNLLILQQLAATITLEEVNAVLRSRLDGDPVLLYFGPDAPQGGEAALRDALARARTAQLAAYTPPPVKPWPYTDFGPPGEVSGRVEVADLGVTFVTFANGVTLTVKATDFRQDELLVRVRLGLGQLGMPRDAITAADMGVELWRHGGLGLLTRSELTRTLGGRRAAASPRMGDDAFELVAASGMTQAAELALQLELMAAMAADPGLRDDAWDQIIADVNRSEAALWRTPASALAASLPALVHGGDLRWTISTAEQRGAWRPEDAASFMRQVITQSPLDVIIVGDVDVEDAVREAARTFGALPPRAPAPEPEGLRDVRFPAASEGPVVLGHDGRTDQGMLFVGWPTGQGMFRNLREHRVGWVLSQLLRDRVTLHFRSGGGATYSPSTRTEFSQVLPEHGYIGVAMELPPHDIDAAISQIESIAARLAAAPVHQEELGRTLGPRAAQGRREVESNNMWWMEHLRGAHADPSRLDLIRTMVADYESITAEEVRAAAERWLRADTALRVKVVPAEGAAGRISGQLSGGSGSSSTASTTYLSIP